MKDIIQDVIKNESKFCEEFDLEKNEHGNFIYDSRNKKSAINLPFILFEYKAWLIDRGIVNDNP